MSEWAFGNFDQGAEASFAVHHGHTNKVVAEHPVRRVAEAIADRKARQTGDSHYVKKVLYRD